MYIDAIVSECTPHSDLGPELDLYVNIFAQAHRNAPGGLSLEIGTRAGGSALAILRVLESLYVDPPFLFTVDPYGEKPYALGVRDQADYIYGSDFYVRSKTLLAPFPNHAHFLMTGEDFVDKVIGLTFWHRGEPRVMSEFSLAFLDGDHTTQVLLKTLRGIERHMAQSALVLIDNANWQGFSSEMVSPYLALELYNGRTAVLRRV